MDKNVEIINKFHEGVKLSKIKAKLKEPIEIIPLIGKFQQLGLLKVVYDPSVDEEPLVQLTEKGKTASNCITECCATSHITCPFLSWNKFGQIC